MAAAAGMRGMPPGGMTPEMMARMQHQSHQVRMSGGGQPRYPAAVGGECIQQIIIYK